MSSPSKSFFYSSWDANLPSRPWFRLFARLIDTSVNGALVFVVLLIVTFFFNYEFAERIIDCIDVYERTRIGNIVSAFLTVFLAMFLNSAFIGWRGSSLGKFLFGIRILNLEGNPIGYKNALKRELMIWSKGMGFGLPIISFVAAYLSYKRLKRDGRITWVPAICEQIQYRQQNFYHKFLCFFGCVILITLILVNYS